MTTGAAGSSGGPRRIVLWFRNDLRLRDNAVLHTAVQKIRSKEADEVRCSEDKRISSKRKQSRRSKLAH
jgi:deoxyribodipyrimidine photolyase